MLFKVDLVGRGGKLLPCGIANVESEEVAAKQLELRLQEGGLYTDPTGRFRFRLSLVSELVKPVGLIEMVEFYCRIGEV